MTVPSLISLEMATLAFKVWAWIFVGTLVFNFTTAFAIAAGKALFKE